MRTTALCFVMAVFAWGSYFYGNAFYMVALTERHGWSVTQVSGAITTGFFSCIPAALVVGWVFDIHGRRWGALWVVAYGALAMGSGVEALSRVDALWQLYLVYMLMGSAYPALAAPAISATLNQRGSGRYGLDLSLALSGASVGGALAAPALVWGSAHAGFDATVTALGVLIPCALLPLGLVLLRPLAGQPGSTQAAGMPEPGARVRDALLSGTCAKIVLVALLSLASQVGFLAHQLSVLGESLSREVAALVITATAVSSAVGRLLVGGLSARFSLRHLSVLTYMVMALGIGIVAFGGSPPTLVSGSIVAGLFVGAVVLLPPMLCRAYFDSAMYGRVYSVIAMGVYAGGGLGPSIAGVIRDASTDARPALLCLAAMSVAAAIVVLSLPERKRQ